MNRIAAVSRRTTKTSSIATRDWTIARKSTAISSPAAAALNRAAAGDTTERSRRHARRRTIPAVRMPAIAAVMRQPNSS
jgi:hypothetical protein